MRVKLIFEIKKNELPKNNKNIWLSFLKYALSNTNKAYREKFFNKNIKEKDYSFCVILPHPKYPDNSNKVILNSQDNINSKELVTMMFSARDEKSTSFIFLSSFTNVKGKTFNLPHGNSMILKQINMVDEQIDEIDTAAVFISPRGSGMLFRDHDKATNKDTFYDINDKDFDKIATEVVRRQVAAAGFPEKDANRLEVKRANYSGNRTWRTMHYGVTCKVSNAISITSTKSILTYLYNSGVGSKHSMGYGFISEVIPV